MTYTTNNILIPHRALRGAISRVALLAAYSRVGKRKHATADASLLILSRFPSFTTPHPNSNTFSAGPSSGPGRFAHPASHSAATSARPSSVTTLNTSKSVFKPRKPACLAAFNVRTLKQADQQGALALTLDSICIDACCLSETRTQDELTAPSLSSRFRLRTSGDAEAAAAGYAGVGTVLSKQAEASLLDWIPVNSRLCAVRLATSVRESGEKDSTTLPPDRLVARLLVERSLVALGLAAPLWPSWHGCTLWNEVPATVARGIVAALKPDHHVKVAAVDRKSVHWWVPTTKLAPNPNRLCWRQLSVASVNHRRSSWHHVKVAAVDRKSVHNVVPTTKLAPNPNRLCWRQLSVASVNHRLPLLLEHQRGLRSYNCTLLLFIALFSTFSNKICQLVPFEFLPFVLPT
ncbi:hypothetical protein T265_06658 [Opisthorchis viverrini]|uniref:Uncharacterized protein n=1 Tax=Opisthorchis viverrini TaxID=6198 RepID=A0A074ZFQ6_OPIVI|nr:hypothetical protein T265_06658 [Opisthorchis viverrini]KER26023.1 hypothetical protein T265_06658 [Opisthorchis viverrini]